MGSACTLQIHSMLICWPHALPDTLDFFCSLNQCLSVLELAISFAWHTFLPNHYMVDYSRFIVKVTFSEKCPLSTQDKVVLNCQDRHHPVNFVIAFFTQIILLMYLSWIAYFLSSLKNERPCISSSLLKSWYLEQFLVQRRCSVNIEALRNHGSQP